MVEAPALFKNSGIYYLTYGACCCGCKGGSGTVIFSASSVKGPWTRQTPHSDINCHDNVPICGGYVPNPPWPSANMIYAAQMWGPSYIPLDPAWGRGERAIIWSGRKWMSGPNAPAWSGIGGACCNGPQGGGPANYFLKSDYQVWIPMNIVNGVASPFPLQESYTLQVPDTTDNGRFNAFNSSALAFFPHGYGHATMNATAAI
jgi:hypothetical protein